MKWDYWIALYLQTHCSARGLRPASINASQATLKGFREYVHWRLEGRGPEQITARLLGTTRKLGYSGDEHLYGAGLLDAAAATAPGGPGAIASKASSRGVASIPTA